MYADATFPDEPLWSGRSAQRLGWSLLPATLIVAGVLASLRLPVANIVAPLPELVVRLIAERVEETVGAEKPGRKTQEPEVRDAAPARVEPLVEPPARQRIDWQAQIPAAAEAALDSPAYAVNPGMDARRKAAAVQFRRSEAPVKRPVWENAERDQLGRLILVSGDCYRVLDDPSVTRRDEFETFGQFLTFCSNFADQPQRLAFVDDIKARRAGQARYARRAAE